MAFETNPPFLQFILCWKSYFEPHRISCLSLLVLLDPPISRWWWYEFTFSIIDTITPRYCWDGFVRCFVFYRLKIIMNIRNYSKKIRKAPINTAYTVVPWCSGYHYCTTIFIKAWTQVLRRLKSYLRRVGDSRWWRSLTMVPAGNKTTPIIGQPYRKKIYNNHHHHHHHQINKEVDRSSCLPLIRFILVWIIYF